MAKEMTLSGCASAAYAAKLAKVEVICSYPIRPYTAIMMELAKMVPTASWMPSSSTVRVSTPSCPW